MAAAQSAEAEAAQLAREAEHRLQEAAERDTQHAQVLHHLGACKPGDTWLPTNRTPVLSRPHGGVSPWGHD